MSGTWRSVVYSISKDKAKEVSTGISSKHHKVDDGKIVLADGEFPLTVEDLFLLDLEPLATTNEVTTDDIAQELEATSSSQVEPEATPTSSPTPEVPVATQEADLSDR